MKTRSLRVAFLSAEVAPLAKAGGLGDVAGALPKALEKLNIAVLIFMPFYGIVDAKKYKPKKIIGSLTVAIDGGDEKISVYETKLPASGVRVYLIKHKFFDGQDIYTGVRVHDVRRFSFFTQAALTACHELGFQPDIVHAQDWHAALAAQMLKTRNAADAFFSKTKTIYTIHNLANQGITGPEIIGYAKLNPNLPVIRADARNGDINFMVQGILASDAVTTVSPRYAKEILHHYQGAGLDNILRQRRRDLYGILNGIDVDAYNPKTDTAIAQRYSLATLQKKEVNKIALQKKLGLPIDKKKCLVGFISRLVWQKGVELIDDDLIKNSNCQFVILGTGQKEYENQLQKLAQKHPNKLRAVICFDEKLARQIYASSDVFLVPSRFEPCGLTQMIAMRYGSVPLVRATGGLADTVRERRKANGFLFKEFSSQALHKTFQRALDVYYQKPKKWLKLQENGMKEDLSWKKSAKEYVRVYEKVLKQA